MSGSLAIPAPSDLLQQFAATLGEVQFTASDGSAVTLDALDPNTLEGVLATVSAMALYELYLRIERIGREMMVDTALDWLPRHAAIWNTPREAARAAIGTGSANATVETTIPQGTAAQSGSVLYATTAAVTVPAGGTASVSLRAQTAGVAANLGGGAVLTLVSAVAGLGAQQITLDAGGMAGGADIEPVETWRQRILTTIRTRPGNGKPSDYVAWAIEAGAAYASAIRSYGGAGTIGVPIAMAGPAVPSAAQIAAVQAYLDARKPVEATVVVFAATLSPIDYSIALNPDTAAIRSIVAAQLAAAFADTAQIGTTWFEQTSWTALAAIAGATSLRIDAPNADHPMSAAQLPTLGAIVFVDAY